MDDAARKTYKEIVLIEMRYKERYEALKRGER
uniref:Uncharacterized protein n=1 Tax=Myoviridae sp. ctplG2 TaxID=2826700 RepID=A0A8S5LWE0_9CAUD|nr:MAG TPA: hypothetical protein [Myoviridae sp. ctplG2]